tara:strand:+ start:257 stop:382 length:126 start_codon:yes stop_codon:yes gene_type:complete
MIFDFRFLIYSKAPAYPQLEDSHDPKIERFEIILIKRLFRD